jgi:uncharacterized coiled-coil protein SlyX
MADMTVSIETIGMIGGYLTTLVGGAWALRGMFERARTEHGKQVQDLKDLITTKFSSQDTEIKLLQQSQLNAGAGLEARFVAQEQQIIQNKEELDRLRNKVGDLVKDIVRLQATLPPH